MSWRGPELAVLCAAGCLLAAVFPECLGELSLLVRQVALLSGDGIAGYTDFGVHGAVFINRARLADTADGLPARVRLAEAVVHEGAHVRCNAAGWSESYLADPKDRSLAVDTPLRPDARPLNGLFQQFVVLCRSVELYERVLADVRPEGREHGPIRRRLEVLRSQAHEATTTLGTHRAALSGRGVSELELSTQRVPS
jgi:HEXXH motif-containing protein